MEVYRRMNHPEREAVAQCTRCGKPVCQECHNPEQAAVATVAVR